jgi:hypothetical protein
MGTTLAGASMMELAWHRAAWARSSSPADEVKLFDLQKAAEGVFFALAKPQWAGTTHFGAGPLPLENDVSDCVQAVFRNLDRV